MLLKPDDNELFVYLMIIQVNKTYQLLTDTLNLFENSGARKISNGHFKFESGELRFKFQMTVTNNKFSNSKSSFDFL